VLDIAEVLPRTRINHLKLNQTAMNNESFRALCNALPSSIYLETLEVAANNLDDVALSSFSNVAPHCINLKNVNFSDNKIQDLRELSTALKANTMLEQVSFQSNAGITNVMAMDLVARTLRSHSSLKRIDFSLTEVDTAARALVAEKLLRLHSPRSTNLVILSSVMISRLSPRSLLGSVLPVEMLRRVGEMY
jgi:Leucine-rich repeat (LRR) protein